jgi:hypothetical protein
MDAKARSKKVVAVVGERVPWRCGPCGTESGFSESISPVTSVAKWICPKCGAQNEFEVEFRSPAR